MSSHSSPLIIIFHTYNWNNTKVVEREVRKNIKKKSTPPPHKNTVPPTTDVVFTLLLI